MSLQVINSDEDGSDTDSDSDLEPKKRVLEGEFTDTETKNTKESTIFSDVIKNISKVNNVLQDLIRNYEHLQKIYRADSFETTLELSSDSELDEYFKHTEKKMRKKNRDGGSDTENWSTTKKDFPATQMLVSDEMETATEKFTSDDEGNASQTEIFRNVENNVEYELDQVEKKDALETNAMYSTRLISEEVNESVTEKIETGKDQLHNDEKRGPDNIILEDDVKTLNASSRTTNTNKESIFNENEEIQDTSNSYVNDDENLSNTTIIDPNEIDILNKQEEIEDANNSFFNDVVKKISSTTDNPNKIEILNKTDEIEDASEDISSTEEIDEIHKTATKKVDENISTVKTTSTKMVEHIVRSEIFNEKNIWTEIAKKTPIKFNISESNMKDNNDSETSSEIIPFFRNEHTVNEVSTCR